MCAYCNSLQQMYAAYTVRTATWQVNTCLLSQHITETCIDVHLRYIYMAPRHYYQNQHIWCTRVHRYIYMLYKEECCTDHFPVPTP
jgi:hypothetical protein